jgi:uncharacterized membrane protein YfcA
VPAVAIAVGAGIVVGLSLGALGAGGSILAVPALVYLLGQEPQLATTGSLVIVAITALSGVAAHRRAGRVRVREGLLVGAVSIPGSIAGARASVLVDPDVLLAGFAGLMLVAAAAMARRARAEASQAGRTPPAPPQSAAAGSGATVPAASAAPIGTERVDADRTRGPAGIARLVAVATGIGLLTGFFGVGGGFVVVPALVLAVGLAMPVATGTSLVVITMTSLVALLTRLGAGIDLDWGVLGAFTAAAVAGSLLGSRLVSRVASHRLTAAFSAVLVVIALYSAFRSVPAIL